MVQLNSSNFVSNYSLPSPCRKYSRLNVRYSRLQQSPVKFTFSERGEMVEEDASDDEGEDINVDNTQDEVDITT